MQNDDRSDVVQDSPLPFSVVKSKPSDIDVETLAHEILVRIRSTTVNHWISLRPPER
jgi:hypothetical protein